MFKGNVPEGDVVAYTLRSYAQMVLIVVFGLLPILFIPKVTAPFEYTKVAFAACALAAAVILYSLSLLRTGTISVGVSYPLCALWIAAGIAFVSSLLSGDLKDSLIGDFFNTQSTVFIALLALVPTVWMMLKPTKPMVMKMYIMFAAGTLILVVYHIARLIFGADTLAFSLFTSNTGTPVGSWNDLALLLGLAIILSLAALEQLTLTKAGRALFSAVSVLSLIMLGVINFFMVWLVLGLVSLVLIVYSLGKDRFSNTQPSLIQTGTALPSMAALIVALIVFAFSVFFVIGGSTLGGWIAQHTGVSYIEVRPSLEATADIARNVYKENAVLGIGPNKFVDAWRLYKDSAINATAFWNTDFSAGNGYITTLFVTTGVLGGITWIAFLLLYVVTGIRRLMNPVNADKMWYFISLSSFVSACYVWGISIMYVPGAVLLLLGALCTGVSLYGFTIISGQEGKSISVAANRRTGFILTLVVITIIIGSVSALYSLGRHYSSIFAFNQSILGAQQGKDIDALEVTVRDAFQLSKSDVYARLMVEYQLSRMNRLIAVPEPTEAQRSEFQKAYSEAINAGLIATQIDAQEPANWAVLARVYATLAALQVEGAQTEALKALEKSRQLNPKNPIPYLDSAIVEGRSGNLDTARTYIKEAIALKPNFSEAFYQLSQLEIAANNVDAAIESTRSVIALEPRNAARYYQLGILESYRNNVDAAVAAFEDARTIDPQYANARYLLALAYDLQGKSEEAKAELKVVLDLNPGNADVIRLIEAIERDGSLKGVRESGANTQVGETVVEAAPKIDESGTVTTTQGVDTTLVNPVNTVPKSGDEAMGAQQ